MFHTRKGKDWTHSYGGDSKSGTFTKHVHKLFAPGADEVILDGEMMVWETIEQRYVIVLASAAATLTSAAHRTMRPCTAPHSSHPPFPSRCFLAMFCIKDGCACGDGLQQPASTNHQHINTLLTHQHINTSTASLRWAKKAPRFGRWASVESKEHSSNRGSARGHCWVAASSSLLLSTF